MMVRGAAIRGECGELLGRAGPVMLATTPTELRGVQASSPQ